MSKRHYDFGTRVKFTCGFDAWQAPQIKQEITISRLEYNPDYRPTRNTFSTVKLITATMTQYGLPRVARGGDRLGIEPYTMPSDFYDKQDAKFLWLNQWNPQPRIAVEVGNLNEQAAVEAMALLCKAQEFTDSGWNRLHKPKFNPITGDDFLWGNLDVFTRLMLGLYLQGVRLVEGNLQDYQMISKFQFDPATIRSLWETSGMLRGMSDEELKEGGASA